MSHKHDDEKWRELSAIQLFSQHDFTAEALNGLSEMFSRQQQLQVDFMGIDISEMNDAQIAEYVRWNALAMNAEAVEMIDCTNWKPWSKSEGLVKDRDALIDEAVDVMCFFMNMMLALNVAPEEIIEQHRVKTMVNAYRQIDEYDAWKKIKGNYLQVFFAFNGPGPWDCEFCDEPVRLTGLNVHHRDHDHSNNDPDNLTASHRRCHQVYHMADGRGPKMREASVQSWTDDRRKKISDGIKNSKKFMCPNCSKETIRGGPTVRHLIKCGVPESEWPAPVRRVTTRTDIEIIRATVDNTDRSPTMCACGAGPFRGSGGMKVHQARSACGGKKIA